MTDEIGRTVSFDDDNDENHPLLMSVDSKASAEIEKSTLKPTDKTSLTERLGNFVAAYDTISFTTSFVFTFAVSMASDHSTKTEFNNVVA